MSWWNIMRKCWPCKSGVYVCVCVCVCVCTLVSVWFLENSRSFNTIFSSVQFRSVTQSCPTLCNPMNCAARQASLSITNSRSSLKLTSIESVMPSSHLILCRPLFLLPPIPPSIKVFSNESTLLMRWPKYWRFSFSIIPSKEHPGLISFRMDWLDLLAVQGTLKSLLQHHSSKALILWCSAFFTVQLSHPYMTTGKTILRQQQRGRDESNILQTITLVGKPVSIESGIQYKLLQGI